MPTVEGLLAALTLSERIALLYQHSPAVPRLGLAAFRTGTEALHGVAWLGVATVFPQAVGLGATWHPELLRAVGEVTSTEVRAKHAADPAVSLNVWAPVVNLLRDPRWGRNEEGYSEDPWLTGLLATAYCRGLRGDRTDVVRTAPTLKHFLAYNNETDRAATSSSVRPRVLHEYDLPAFAAPLRAGVVDAVMPAYNLVNGRPCHVSGYLEDCLRRWAPHELLVVSDAEAPSNLVAVQRYFADHATAHAAALRAGVDSFTELGDDASATVARLTEALERGLLDEEDVDRAAGRVLALRARTGEFADPAAEPAGAGDPYAGIGPDAIDRPQHRALARQAAREQVVLLRNDGDLLPLRAGTGTRVAVVGPFARTVCTDWYSGTPPYRVGVADGLLAAVAALGGSVAGAEGFDQVGLRARDGGGWVTVTDADEPVLRLAGGPDGAPPTAARFDLGGWGDGVLTLRSAVTGRFVTADGATLRADRPEPGGWFVHETFTLEPATGTAGGVLLRARTAGRYVVAGADGTLAATADDPARATALHLVTVHDGAGEAAALAADADVAVVVLGNDPHVNGRETEDRTTLALPPEQDRLLRAVVAANPRTVLVVMSSYPYAITWAQEHVPAVLWTSHAGQEAGNALADVLLGVHAPSGRLAQTWYRDDADLPDLLEYDVISARRTYAYLDPGQAPPLYPFGHGLTYTTFRYGPATATVAGGQVTVEVEVTNTGHRTAVEVVQLYSRADAGPAAHEPERPRRRLQAFERLALEPGRTRTARLAFPLERLAHWDVATHAFRVDPGRYLLLVGRSCEAVEATAHVEVPGEPRGPRPVTAAPVAAVDADALAGVRLVDTTREHGEAVEVDGPPDGRPDGEAPRGRLLLRRADLPTGPVRFTARVSRTRPGTARLELRLDDPDGPLLGTVDVPSTGGRYAWTDVSTVLAPLAPGEETVRDLYLVLVGAQRLDRVRLEPRTPARPAAP